MSNLKHLLKSPIFIGVVLALVAFNVVFYFFSPEDLVESIGVKNSYLVVFLIAAAGGLSSFTSSILYGAIATFAAGGATPWLLGICAGIGIGIGDSLIFWLLHHGYTNIGEKWKDKLESYQGWLESVPLSVQYIGIYLILGFTPLPNDIVLLTLVIFGFKLKKLMPIIFLSAITIATITAYLGDNWLSWF